MPKTESDTQRGRNFTPFNIGARALATRVSMGVTVSLLLLAEACGGAEPSTVNAAEVTPTAASEASANGAPTQIAPAGSAKATATVPSASGHAAIVVSAETRAFLDAPDRLPEDRLLDEGRKPAELLTFLGVKPGMTVAELGAGGGYTSEFLARAVGPTGRVYGQNTKMLLEKFAEKPWSERLKRPVMERVVRADRDFEDPLPPEAKNLDVVLINLFYHDLYWMKADRDKMNKAVFAALKPGGIYAVIDHAAKDGDGANDVQTLHRIEQSEVVRDVQKSGFKLVQEGDFLKNPADTKDWSTSPKSAGEKRGTSDRFALLFKKP